jgi:excisionase family DNA binding protein
MSNLVSIDEAASAIGLSKSKLYKSAKAGKAPHYRCGRAVRFDVEELRQWMRQQALSSEQGS